MRIGNVKIAAAMLALRSTTAKRLAVSTGLPEETVKSWLKGHRRWFDKDEEPTKSRGRKRTIWRLRDEALEDIRLHLREQWPSVGAEFLDEIDEKPDFERLKPLIAAEELIDAIALTPAEEREESDRLNADGWTRAAVRRLQDWARVGVHAPLQVRRRLRACEICLQSDFALDVRVEGMRLLNESEDMVEGAKGLIALFDRLASLKPLPEGVVRLEDPKNHRRQAEDLTIVLAGFDPDGVSDRIAAMAIMAFGLLRRETRGRGWQDRMRSFLMRMIEVLEERVEDRVDRSPVADALKRLTLEQRLPRRSLLLMLEGLCVAPFLVDNDEIRGWLREMRESRVWQKTLDAPAQQFLAHSRHMSLEQISQDRWGTPLGVRSVIESEAMGDKLASLGSAPFLRAEPPAAAGRS